MPEFRWDLPKDLHSLFATPISNYLKATNLVTQPKHPSWKGIKKSLANLFLDANALLLNCMSP